jgi:hypothetical protein
VGADITLDKASNIDLRLSYNRYSKDAKALMVEFVKGF